MQMTSGKLADYLFAQSSAVLPATDCSADYHACTCFLRSDDPAGRDKSSPID